MIHAMNVTDAIAQRRSIKKFQERFKTPPDLYSMGTYDSVVLLAQAFRKAGHDREKIRDALRTMKALCQV